jgi:hypothetical protein
MMRRVPILWAAAALCGCAGATPRLDQPTVRYAGNLYLELWVQGEQNLAAIYRVNGKGDLGFGGGGAAHNRRLTWKGTMSPGDLDQLRAMLQEHGWYACQVASAAEPPKRLTRIELRWDGHHHCRMTVRGASPDVEPLRALLDQAARTRLESDLETLPKPSSPE